MTLGLFGLAILLILLAALVPMEQTYKRPLFIAGIIVLILAVVLLFMWGPGYGTVWISR